MSIGYEIVIDCTTLLGRHVLVLFGYKSVLELVLECRPTENMFEIPKMNWGWARDN